MADAPTKIFLSYARSDASDLASRLATDLDAHGFEVFFDNLSIAGGEDWSARIEEGIEACDVLLALMTPASYRSNICRAEQLFALKLGRRVIPVLADANAPVPLHLFAKVYRDFSQPSLYDESFRLLREDIEGGSTVKLPDKYRETRVKFVTVPPTVQNEIQRPEAVKALRDTILRDTEHPVALTALEGMGGIGKTVLAQALCRDPVVKNAFPDGIVWVTVGQERSNEWFDDARRQIAILIDVPGKPAAAPETAYYTALHDAAALVVLDDVWGVADLNRFLADSPRSRFLFTTRIQSIASSVAAQEHRVDLLDLAHARELLAHWANADLSEHPSADDIVRECGYLPLAIAQIGGVLRRRASEEDWQEVLQDLKNADLEAIADALPPGQAPLFRSVEISVNDLSAARQEQYKQLAWLLEDMPATVPILQAIWRVDTRKARSEARKLADLSLAQWSQEAGTLRLHDLQLDYARARLGHRDAQRLVQDALRLSSHVLDRDPNLFASQFTGRLLGHESDPIAGELIRRVAAHWPIPWFRCLRPSLHPPGTPLLRTLVGHASWVGAVAVTSDGRRAVSGSQDNTLRVWDLDAGREIRTLEGHSNWVNTVAVTPDGRRAVSGSWDKTLKVWDLETGREIRTLEGHSNGVNTVAVTPDGRRAVSGSWDKTLKVWDLETGREIRTLEGHSNSVNAVAVTPDGRRAVSGSDDSTLKVWDLETGREIRTLEGHSNWVYAVAVTPDGRRAVSGSWDMTLKVWDLETGREIRTLEGHSNRVNTVAVTPDGRRAVSGSWDKTLKVWDLETGREIRTLEGHSNRVNTVAVTPDGRRAVSGSDDSTLKVWDLETGREIRTLEGHSHWVLAVAVTPDGRRAVSGSDDSTLKVWDLETGREIRTVEGHSNWVTAVAVTPDGRRAVSGSWDKTLKVWDLETGREIRTVEGHSNWVTAVAVTPDGRRAVSGSDDSTLKVWDLETGREIRTLEGHSNRVLAVAVTPDGRRAVSGSGDHTLKVWDLETGREIRTVEGHSNWVTAVAVTPDGRRAVSGSWDKTLKVWDLETGREIRTLEGHSNRVNTVAVTPDGRRAVSGSDDRTLKVWDLDTGYLVATFRGDAEIQCCAVSSQGQIFAGDAGGALIVLELVEPSSA